MDELYITEAMISTKLSQLDIHKLCGPDHLHPLLLRELASELSVSLCIIMNKSLQSKTLSIDWKKNKCLNSLPIIGQLAKLVLCAKLWKSLFLIIYVYVQNEHFSDKQYGFVPKRSTLLQLLNIIDEWTLAVDDRNKLNCLCLDFMKAFDTVRMTGSFTN